MRFVTCFAVLFRSEREKIKDSYEVCERAKDFLLLRKRQALDSLRQVKTQQQQLAKLKAAVSTSNNISSKSFISLIMSYEVVHPAVCHVNLHI